MSSELLEPKRPNRRRFERNQAQKKGADYQTVNPDCILAAIVAVARAGGALRFGYTRDGGAYAIGVYGDDSPYTDYIKPNEGIDEYLMDIAIEYKQHEADGYKGAPTHTG
jgi:hypothetical protein